MTGHHALEGSLTDSVFRGRTCEPLGCVIRSRAAQSAPAVTASRASTNRIAITHTL